MHDEEPMDNEDRADLGTIEVMAADEAQTAISDVLAYVAHLCDRCGLDPAQMFDNGLCSYDGDFEDGPRAVHTFDADRSLAEQLR